MRAFASWLLPALATFAAWWVFLGLDEDGQYTVLQAVGLGLVLIAIGIACGWLVRGLDLLAVIVSAVVGVSVACWISWSRQDDSGLFVIGWFLVTVGVAVAAAAVILVTRAVKLRREPSA